jgi:hypothetical protein
MAQSHIATAADYADAMMTARRAKSVLFLILLVVLLAQLALFFVARYTNYVIPSTADATTQPAAYGPNAPDATRYVLGVTTFLGMILPTVLAIVLLLILMIMVVGRLIGVSRLVSAFIWCLILGVFLFPWQAFFSNAWFKVPGVLFTWDEMRHAKFGEGSMPEMTLHWARFVVFPVLALIILLAVQIKSNRGLGLALGEASIDTMGETSEGVA